MSERSLYDRGALWWWLSLLVIVVCSALWAAGWWFAYALAVRACTLVC